MPVQWKRFAPVCLAFIVCTLFACSAPERTVEPTPMKDYARPLAPGEKALVKVGVDDYPDFETGYWDRPSLVEALDESIAYLHKPSSLTHFPVEGISHGRVLRSIEAFRALLIEASSSEEFAERLRRDFDVYMSAGCDWRGTVLFTGYCEPILSASRARTAKYRFPLYRLPKDLVKNEKGLTLGRRIESGALVPYYTREEIDRDKVLEGRGLELAWVANPLDAYIVHVQGSATLLLPDGSKLKIGYAGKNGKPYTSLGQILVEEGRFDASELSLDRIRKHFDRHPGELLPYLYRNESYIFFTENEGGPFGSIGAKVTPYRTIATDKSVFPRASLTYIDTALPYQNRSGEIKLKPYSGFALDQDTGGAIRSAGRVDVFLGTGDQAEKIAGRTRCEGKLYYLFLREGSGGDA